MNFRVLPFACVALLLLGLAATFSRVHTLSGPAGEEATHVSIVQSLWHDRDLAYEEKDLLRAYHVWNLGPRGLTLITNDGGRTVGYGEPFVYALAALPFYGLLGVQGLAVFNMALWLAMVAAAWWAFRGEPGRPGLFLAGFFFASAAFAYVFRCEPVVFAMACLFFPLLLWIRLRRRAVWTGRDLALLAGAGVLLAALFLAAGPAVLVALPILVDLVWQRRWRGFLALLVPALVAAGLVYAVHWRLAGSWSPYQAAQRSAFEDEFPAESRRDLWQLRRGARIPPWQAGPRHEAGLALLGRNAGYFLAGRHAGLLPWFPFALLALALYAFGPKDRARHLLLAAVAVFCLFQLLWRPLDWNGGPEALGNRAFAIVYPALLLLPGSLGSRRGLLLAFAAAGFWTTSALAPEPGDARTRTPMFRALPFELTLLTGGSLPGYTARTWGGAIWVVPRDNFYVDESHPNGVWVRGASRSEVVVISPEPIDRLRFEALSLSAENVLTVDSGRETAKVRFDTEGKRQGAPIDLATRLAARDIGVLAPAQPEYLYRLTLTTTDGWMPARRLRDNADPRYLGAFLDFTGGGL
ncbi:MAG TPA: hypothetical protein VMW27_16220 [Thermoanaerobaculia bacterium]|nr:hypothetical protein [Thermoanaerobaculia bacterium]